MYRKSILLAAFCLILALGNVASALYLAFDITYPIANPEEPNHVIRNAATARGGYYNWASARWWDLSYHDPVWAALPSGAFSPLGIQGCGVDAMVKVGYEGDTSLKVLGMTFEGDGDEPRGLPSGDPIANSFIISHRHWGNEPNDPNSPRYSHGSIFVTFRGAGLVKGDYTVTSYHNCPNNPADPRPTEWYVEDINDNDVMPLIRVYGPGVTQVSDEETTDVNVPIQHVTTDAELVPALVKFSYTGVGDVTVMYMSPPGGDHREGGAAVLNTFILEGGDPGMATFPRPAGSAVGVHPDAVLKWKSGLYVDVHDVYFSADFDDVNDSIALVGDGQDANEYDPPGSLALGRTYYWRVDEVNAVHPNSPWRGMVWQFTIDDGKAADPVVQRGDLPHDVNLAWTPGTFAVSHDLYFGTDRDDVNDATTSSPEFINNLPLDSNNFEIP
ncbi:MAG: hypothetical protein ACYS4W_06230, partial [Planctomycetota bacterium]